MKSPAVRFRLLFALAVAVGMVAAFQLSGGREADAHTHHTTLRAQHSGKCLAVNPSDQRNGAVVFQWSCGADNNLLVQDTGDGYHYIKFRHSNKCLTVDKFTDADGGTLNQWDCLGQDNQKWRGDFANGVFELHGSQANPDKCITVHANSIADGAVVNQWQCVNQANQGWSLTPVHMPRAQADIGGIQCHPSYQGGLDVARGGCIRANVGDYDCVPTQDGPNYVMGTTRVVGVDEFFLDPEVDGFGCLNALIVPR